MVENLTKNSKQLKIIQFKLCPMGNTKRAMLKNAVKEMDADLSRAVDILAKGLDTFYLHLITNALNTANLEWDSYIDEEDESIKEADVLKDVTGILKEYCQTQYKNAKLFDVAFIKDVFTPFVKENQDLFEDVDELLETLDNTSAAGTLLSKYFVSRKAIITGELKGSVAERILTNFKIYAENMRYTKKLYGSMAPDVRALISEDTIWDDYNKFLTQEGVDIYNGYLAGEYEGDVRVKDGINVTANLANQKNKDKKYAFVKKLNQLQKQIMSETTPKFTIDAFADNVSYTAALKEFVAQTARKAVDAAIEKLYSLENADLDGIYLSELNTHLYSKRLTKNPTAITAELCAEITKEVQGDAKKVTKKMEAAIDKLLKTRLYSLAHLNEIISRYNENGETIQENIVNDAVTLYEDFQSAEESLTGLLEKDTFTPVDHIDDIREYLNAINEIGRMLKLFKNVPEDNIIDSDFYNGLEEILDDLKECNKFLNKSRNYLTKKTSDYANKVVTCLGNSGNLRTGWTQKDETCLDSVKNEIALLKRDNKYYVFTYEKGAKTKLPVRKEPISDRDYGKLMIYSTPDAAKILPKHAFTSFVKAADMFADADCQSYVKEGGMKEPITITREIWEIKNRGWFKTEHLKAKGEDPEKLRQEYEHDLYAMIDFYKEFLVKSSTLEKHNPVLKETKEYENIGQFFDDVNRGFYNLGISYVNDKELNKVLNENKGYLFELTSQALRNNKQNDTQANYLRYLWSDENIKNPAVQLKANRIFIHRDAAIERKVTHPKGTVMVNRIAKNGKRIPHDVYQELYLYANKKIKVLSSEASIWEKEAIYKTCTMDRIKDNRYTKETLTIGLCISINDDVNNMQPLNKRVNALIREKEDINILSVVRGERNLLYYTIMNSKDKKIIEKGSLNEVNGIDYQDRLRAFTSDKKDAQRNWKQSKSITSLKEGYLKHAISKILKLAIQYDAIICIEDLNDRFKDKKSALDNQVYKLFESTLVARMGCYIRPEIPAGERGSITNPYQMADPDFDKGIQNGILFRVEPSYTANMCPVTGYTPVFDMRDITTVEKKRNFLSKLDKIIYNEEKNRFEITFDYKNFKTVKDMPVTKWTLGSHVKKYTWNPTGKKTEETDVTAEIKRILYEAGIDYRTGDIPLENLSNKGVTEFFDAFRTMTYMQYRDADNNDTFVSPSILNNSTEYIPESMEENKAYHIGLKGLLSIEAIKNEESLGIDSKKWFTFKQQ